MIHALASIASGLASLTACAILFSFAGIGVVFLMEPRLQCNPYAVFPCPCSEEENG